MLVAPNGTVIDSQVQEHSVTRGDHGFVEMDMRIWWDEFKTLYPALLNRNDVRVKGICISGMGPCIAVTDTNDEPAAPAALYARTPRNR